MLQSYFSMVKPNRWLSPEEVAEALRIPSGSRGCRALKADGFLESRKGKRGRVYYRHSKVEEEAPPVSLAPEPPKTWFDEARPHLIPKRYQLLAAFLACVDTRLEEDLTSVHVPYQEWAVDLFQRALILRAEDLMRFWGENHPRLKVLRRILSDLDDASDGEKAGDIEDVLAALDAS